MISAHLQTRRVPMQTGRFAVSTWARVFMLTLLAALFLGIGPASSQDSAASLPGFDHVAIGGIPLAGRHLTIPCESCHINNQTAGTPRACVACHNTTASARARGKPASHPPTSNNCSSCHSTSRFSSARIDHTFISQPCQTCHKGSPGRAKPANHIASTDQCDNCHVTTGFKNPRVDHGSVIGECADCHNGRVARGKPRTHPPASETCGACHITLTFANPLVNHNQMNQPCVTCHDGFSAIGKPANHVAAPEDCSLCHTPDFEGSFAMVKVNHDYVTGPCSSCHVPGSGVDISPDRLRPSWHIEHGMVAECSNCHFSTMTFSLARMDHDSVTAPCSSCHDAGSGLNLRPDLVKPDWHDTAGIAEECDACHTSTTAGFAYPNVIPGLQRPGWHFTLGNSTTCVNCHNTSSASSSSWPGVPYSMSALTPYVSFWNPEATKSTPATAECDLCHNAINPALDVYP